MRDGSARRVDIIVTQRDRLSLVRESFESLLAMTPPEHARIIYVAPVGMSKADRAWLDRRAAGRPFLRVDPKRQMNPAESRNFGLAFADAEYVVFTENDVVYCQDWLAPLMACADETGAAVVAPVTCEGRPAHTIIHHVGEVETNRDTFDGEAPGRRDVSEEFYLQGQTRDEAAPLLVRRRTRYPEMHCFLVRRAVFDRVGPFDPDIVSKEYLDFSWSLNQLGAEIWVEPRSVVTFLVPSEADPVRLRDLPYFLLRWSVAWQSRSHDALKSKWGLREEGFVAARRALSDWRIVHSLVDEPLRRVPVLGKRWGFRSRIAKLVRPILIKASDRMVQRYDAGRQADAGAAGGREPQRSEAPQRALAG